MKSSTSPHASMSFVCVHIAQLVRNKGSWERKSCWGNDVNVLCIREFDYMLCFQFVKSDCFHGAVDSLINKLKRITLETRLPTSYSFNKNISTVHSYFRD